MSYFICWSLGLMLGLLIGLGLWHQAMKRCDEAMDILEETLRAYAETLASRHLPLSSVDDVIIRQELEMLESMGLGDEQKGNA